MTVRLSALRAGRSLSPGTFLLVIDVRGLVNAGTVVRLEGLGKLKRKENEITSLGIEPENFHLVIQYLNQIRVPSEMLTFSPFQL
jgi:hypothetical protein